MRPILSMGSDKMIRSMASRARRITPLNETELKIICSATKLFLENGFSKTTFTMISKDSGVLKGNIAYYFHAKEDMLFLLVQELMDFHGEIIEAVDEHSHSHLLAYALEITSQIALCETNEAARDLYYSAYNHPGTFEYIKDWTAKKNYRIFKSLHPDWTEHEFRVRENIASHMEFSALTSPCDKDFTLENKITLILDSLMKFYDVPENDRNEVITRILNYDYRSIGNNIFDKFTEKFYKSKQALQ